MFTRTRTQTYAAALLLGAAALGCDGERPPNLFAVGDPCRTYSHSCLADNEALRCEDQAWALTSCDVICAENGPAYVADGCDFRCVCVLADPESCEPGASVCDDDQSVSYCTQTQTWEQRLCEQECATLQLESRGCIEHEPEYPGAPPRSACSCTAEGTFCDSAAALPSCVDESTVGLCIDNTWVFEDCSLACEGAGVCDPWLSPAGCVC